MNADALPLVTIGLPVYNGGTQIARAISSLLNQDYPAFEIVISDNASTDQTSETCREFARRDSRISYQRQPENIGPLRNFFGLAERARGRYFMWASHDDMWSPGYVTALVRELDRHPEAVLATPHTEKVLADGSPSRHRPDRPAPGPSRFDNIRVLTRDGAASWVFGLFRTDWLRQHATKLVNDSDPEWVPALIWMFETVLAHKVVGSDQAIFYKAISTRVYVPQSQRDRMVGWISMFHELNRICIRHAHGRDRFTALRLAWYLCYRKYLRRGNPIGTPVRILKVLAMATYFRLRYGPLVPATVSSTEH